jgi:hypothetical protein
MSEKNSFVQPLFLLKIGSILWPTERLYAIGHTGYSDTVDRYRPSALCILSDGNGALRVLFGPVAPRVSPYQAPRSSLRHTNITKREAIK